MIETERRRYYHYSLKDKQKALQHWNELKVSGWDWQARPPWISKFAHQNKLSSHLTQKKPAKVPRVWVVDESALFDDNVVRRSYSPVGTTPSINAPNIHKRDTIVLCASNDGIKIPLYFLEHTPKRFSTRRNAIGELKTTVIDKGISGINLVKWREWIREVFLDKSLPAGQRPEKGDIIMWDCLSIHSDSEALKSLMQEGIQVKQFPKGSAAELSILDNSLFRDFKLEFKKFLSQLPTYLGSNFLQDEFLNTGHIAVFWNGK